MTKRVLLVGNPNCGKTTLFNALTGSQQSVGNWPGVTIAKKAGWYTRATKNIEIIDLPGVYALSLPEHMTAKDAQITAQVLMDNDFDLIINVIDACHLERHLYLTSQLLELGKPIVVALNMMDLAAQAGIQIDKAALAEQLHCPVVTIQANRQIGFDDLDRHIVDPFPISSSGKRLYPYLSEKVQAYVQDLQGEQSQQPELSLYHAYRRIEHNLTPNPPCADLDIVLADARYQMVHQWVQTVQSQPHEKKEQWTAKLDRILLHRLWGLPIFFMLLYGVFFLAIGIGGALQSGFDVLSEAVFMQNPAWLMTQWHAPAWLIHVTAFGAGQALHTLVTFIPVLAIMYFLLAFLEASGYMARVAFIMDRVMRSFGLPGQAFVPMIIGFGCNVPAILAARTMHTERDRFLTVLMNPFMSCSARLAIYTTFVAVFFPSNGYQIIFSLYLLGIGMAILTGYIARRTFLAGPVSPLILELPTYHFPSMRRLMRDAWIRLRYFLIRATKVILPLCILLSLFTMSSVYAPLVAYLDRWIMPIFAPMGLQHENWPAVISLITGMLAKEVVIGTLNNLYGQIHQLTHTWQVMPPVDIWQTVQQAGLAMYDHLKAICGIPTDASVDIQADMLLPGQLQHYFGSALSAYAYLLFILLYMPCVSTMAAIRQEANRRLMWLSIGWSLLLAYGTSVIFYQLASWIHTSPGWWMYLGGVGIGVSICLGMIRLGGRRAVKYS